MRQIIFKNCLKAIIMESVYVNKAIMMILLIVFAKSAIIAGSNFKF